MLLPLRRSWSLIQADTARKCDDGVEHCTSENDPAIKITLRTSMCLRRVAECELFQGGEVKREGEGRKFEAAMRKKLSCRSYCIA